MDELVIQEENKPLRDEKGRLLPGNTANPNGRPKGKSLKEYQAEKFRMMSDEDKELFLEDVSKEKRWAMAEGNPATDVDVTTKGLPIISLSPEIVAKNELTPRTEPDS